MTMQLDGLERFVPVNAEGRSLAGRLIATSAPVIVGVLRWTIAELAYMIREDIGHGRIERQREDWER